MTMTEDPDTRTSIGKALDLLRAFEEDGHDGVGVSELARRAGLSKSTAHRLLSTMHEGGAISRVGKLYRKGSLFHQLQQPARKIQHDNLREWLTPHLTDLYAASGLTVYLAALDGYEVLYLNKLHGTETLRSPVRIGGRAPAYSTAVGKAILAHDNAAVRRLQNVTFTRFTDETIPSHQLLLRELSQIRANGYAVDRGETVSTVRCLAAPVLGPDGRAAAAISVSWNHPNGNVRDHAENVHATARAASRTLTMTLAQRQHPTESARPLHV